MDDEYDWDSWDAAVDEYLTSQGYEQPQDWQNLEDSGTADIGDYTRTETFDDGSTIIYDLNGNLIGSTPATDGGPTTGADLLGSGSGGVNLSGLNLSNLLANKNLSSALSGLKGLVTNSSGGIDIAKLLPLAAGLYGSSQSNSRTQPAGYQGKIPTYTATRQAPGAGQQLSGNVSFKRPDGTVVNPNTTAAPTAVAPTLAGGGLLESGGFVVPADVVSHLGNGSSEAGLKLLAQQLGATPIKGQGDGMSDSIKTTIDGHQPARVANEEARLTKAQVEAAGGAKKLYAMMDKIRQARTGSKEQGKQIDPSKFVPGGAVQGYATGGTTVPAGATGVESNLSNWAGDYVTDMLGKGQALSEMPYEQYQGQLTAGPSALQTKTFEGLQNTAFPGNLGQTFSNTTAPTIGSNGSPVGSGGVASAYMNPYLSNVLNPQLEEMRRQAEINNLSSLGSLTKSGAFGGGRQAIMESEAGRNLLTEQNKTIGQGYFNAFDKAQQQFNTEQEQAKGLAGLMAQQGQTQQGLESADVAAQKAQFEEARLNPYKMVQFQQSLLSGLPLAAQTYNQAPTDNLTQFSNAATTVDKLLAALKQT